MECPLCVLFSYSVVSDSCLPMDYSLPGSSVDGISQEKVLKWVGISLSRGPSRPRDWTCISCIGRHILYHGATWEAPTMWVAMSRYVVSQSKYSSWASFSLPHFLSFSGTHIPKPLGDGSGGTRWAKPGIFPVINQDGHWTCVSMSPALTAGSLLLAPPEKPSGCHGNT